MIMKSKSLHINELNQLELKQISGGTFNYFGYAMGYLVGKAVATVKGAYASGHDAAQNNCECD
jgi:bacteriocin-like protein